MAKSKKTSKAAQRTHSTAQNHPPQDPSTSPAQLADMKKPVQDASLPPAPDKQQLHQEAWALFHDNQWAQAESFSLDLIKKNVLGMRETPFLQARLMLGMKDSLTQRPRQALDRLLSILLYMPNNHAAKGAYLDVLKRHIPTRPNDKVGRLIFGLGTGRCGSTSLSHLLAAQDNTYASHEHPPVVNWQGPSDALQFHVRRMSLLSHLFGHVCDVSHWWLPRIDAIVRVRPDARFVVLQRDRQETIASFLSIKGGDVKGSLHHWIEHDGRFYRKTSWEGTYPKFDTQDKASAIGLYWDQYYQLTEQAVRRHPEHVLCINTASLSDPEGQARILKFCGFKEPRLPGVIKKNQNNIDDGSGLWPNPFRLSPWARSQDKSN